MSPRVLAGAQQISARPDYTVIPFALDVSLYPLQPATADPVVGLLGSMHWFPSRSAAERLVTRIWPLVKRRVPNARLLIGGWNARRYLERLEGPDITLVENLAHPTDFFSRVAVMAYAPARGTGMKVKVLESMAYGVPVVTTAEGAEGLACEDGIHCSIREDDDALAEAIVEQLGDDKGRRTMREAARVLVEERYSREPFLGADGRALRSHPAIMTDRRAFLVVPEIPTPPRSGNAWRDLQQLTVLGRLGFSVHVVAARRRWDLRDDEEAAGGRLLEGGVTYLSEARAEPREALTATVIRKAGYLVGAGGHPFGWWLPETLVETLRGLATRAQPLDVALIRSIFMHEIPQLRQVWPGRIVVDCHDSDVHLAGELLRTVRGLARLGPWANLLGVRRVVERYLPLADEVWAASAEDASRLGGQARGARLLVVPSGMDERQAAAASSPGVDGTALLVANFGYGPNARGAEWLLRSVWPAVRERVPAATLWLVGARMPTTLERLAAATPGVDAPGQLAEVTPLLRDDRRGGGPGARGRRHAREDRGGLEPGQGRRRDGQGCRGAALERGGGGGRGWGAGVRGAGERTADGRRASPRDGRERPGAVPTATDVGGGAAGGSRRLDRREHGSRIRAPARGHVSARVPVALVIGEFGAGALAGYYARALEMLGWRIVRYDMDRGYTRGGLLAHARPLRRLLRWPLWTLMAHEAVALARRHRPQLVLATKAPFLGPESVRRLRLGGAPVAMIYPDSPYGAYTQRLDVLEVLGAYDRVYIGGHHVVSRLHADGVASAAYLPFAFDAADYAVDGHAATPSCRRAHAIVFIGQRNDKRDAWLAALAGLDVGVWGIGWERSDAARRAGHCIHRDSVRGAAAGAIYRGATLALNVLLPDNVPAHNMRTFEIPPCGILMLTEATTEIASFFEPERACLVAGDPTALRSQAERALGDSVLTRAVAEEGARVAAPHTYQARARTILADLGLAVPRSVGAGGPP